MRKPLPAIIAALLLSRIGVANATEQASSDTANAHGPSGAVISPIPRPAPQDPTEDIDPPNPQGADRDFIFDDPEEDI